MSNEETLRRALETATAQLKNIHEQLGGDELAREIKVCDEALAARHEQRGAVEAERERCAKIAEYQSKIPDYTEVQRAHIYCAASIAAAIRVAAERERCAKIAELFVDEFTDRRDDQLRDTHPTAALVHARQAQTASDIAAAIRKRPTVTTGKSEG